MTGNKSKRHRYGAKRPKANKLDDKVLSKTDFVDDSFRKHGFIPYGRGGGRARGAKGKGR